MTLLAESLLAIVLLAANEPARVSVIDFVEKRCAEGDQRSCERLEELDRDLHRHKRLLDYALAFNKDFRGQDHTYDNKPDLVTVYPIVLRDFFEREVNAGFENLLDENRVPGCASHYHNHWRNRKLWWPTNDAGKPDWERIYVYIVDHYYGYCLRRS